MTHEEKNFGGRAEYPGSDEQKISKMLSDLKRVKAPKDFDFHLKARIANAKPSDYRKPGLFPILKYAMPLALFLVVGAGIMVNISYNNWQKPENVEVPAATNDEILRTGASEPKDTTLPATSPEILIPGSGTDSGPDTRLAVRPTPEIGTSKDLQIQALPTPVVPAGFSRDSALAPAPTPIVPKEFRSTNTNTSSNSSNTSTEVPSDMVAKPLNVRDALESIGIEADLEEKKWKVKSVKDSTIAGQMGLKAGDKIESIDGKAIDEKTVYKDGAFKVKMIRVRRGTTAVDLALPKPQE